MIIYCLSIFVFIALSGTVGESATINERTGEPETFIVGSEDPEMNRAIKRARDTVDSFVKQLVSRRPSQTHFSVKKPFPLGKDPENEHIVDLRYDGKRLHGKIGNTPVNITTLKIGDTVSLLPSEISDWMILEDGHIVGGFTFRVLWQRMTGEERR